MTILWTFDSQAKAQPIVGSLDYAGISYEAQTKAKAKGTNSEVTLLVDEKDYVRAKKILMKHRKRRTPSERADFKKPID